MALIALRILEPANVVVSFELKKPTHNGEVIAKLMKRFIYSAGATGAMQIATLVIITRLATSKIQTQRKQVEIYRPSIYLVFVFDKMSSKSLSLLIAALILSALNVPLNIAFAVAQYQ